MTAPTTPSRTIKAAWRGVLAAGMALAIACSATAVHAAPSAAAQKIADHFSSVRTMTGDFVQFGPSGEQTGGKFYIDRPGKIRFNYEDPAGFWVVSDGQSVVIHNEKLRTADLYPLSKTPLKLLLDSRIDLSGEKVQSVEEGGDLTTVKLADRSLFGDSTIQMMFDPETYALRQWTITDAQGKDTTVMIYNVKEGASVDASMFKINYDKVNRLNTPERKR